MVDWGNNMKKILISILAVLMLAALAACGGGAGENAPPQTDEPSSSPAASLPPRETDEPDDAETDDAGTKALVVYFSWSGNTEAVAAEIQSQTGADIFELTPQEPYTDDYNELLSIAQEEKNSGARPKIDGSAEDFESYDLVFVGFPNWWVDMPMILYSFFDQYDLTGKTIAPFCTSGGSGFSNTIAAIEQLEPEAEVLKGLHIGSSGAASPESRVSEWLGSLGLV